MSLSCRKRAPDLIYLCFPGIILRAVTGDEGSAAGMGGLCEPGGAVIILTPLMRRIFPGRMCLAGIYDGAWVLELRSFQEVKSLNGLRLAYTVVPKDIVKCARGVFAFALGQEAWDGSTTARLYRAEGSGRLPVNEEGKAQIRSMVDRYMKNARYIWRG